MDIFKRLINSRTFIVILLIATILVALFLRLILSPYDGYPEDMILFKEWSRNTVSFGMGHIYDQSVRSDIMLPNYMPGYLYFLYFSGLIYKNFISPDFIIDSASLTILLKINAIIFDLATALLIFYVLKKEFGFWAGYLGLILYAFNPAILILSGYWGQVDSIPTFFILLSLILAVKNKFLGSWLFMVMAIFIKLQSIIFIPLILILNLIKKKYYLFDLAKNMFFSLILIFLIISPFLINGTFPNFINTTFHSVGFYKYVSMNAFNIWWPLIKGDYRTVPDTEKLFNIIPYFYIGLFLFAVAYVFALITLFYQNNKFMTYLVASFVAFSFFMLPTEIHERYLFPLFALLAMVIWKNRKLLFIYLTLSLTFFINLDAVLYQKVGERVVPFGIKGTGVQWWYWLIINSVTIIHLVIFIYFIYLLIYYLRLRRVKNSQINLISRP